MLCSFSRRGGRAAQAPPRTRAPRGTSQAPAARRVGVSAAACPYRGGPRRWLARDVVSARGRRARGRGARRPRRCRARRRSCPPASPPPRRPSPQPSGHPSWTASSSPRARERAAAGGPETRGGTPAGAAARSDTSAALAAPKAARRTGFGPTSQPRALPTARTGRGSNAGRTRLNDSLGVLRETESDLSRASFARASRGGAPRASAGDAGGRQGGRERSHVASCGGVPRLLPAPGVVSRGAGVSRRAF